MEKIDISINKFTDHPEARLDTIYVDWNEIHDVRMAFTTWIMKEWPHEFIKSGDNSFEYRGVYIKYDEKVDLS